MSAYSYLKFMHHPEKIEQLRQGQHPYPLHIQIDPYNPCQHDCHWCAFRHHKDDDMNALFNASDWIRTPKMIEIIDSCSQIGVKSLEISGGGEPTLHPDIIPIILRAVEQNIEIGLVTNGCSPIWRKKRLEMIDALTSVTWTRFSLDAATSEVHQVVHATKKEDDFKQVLLSIKALSGSCHVGVSFVALKENYHQILDATKLVRDLGANNIRITSAEFMYKDGKPDPHYHDGHHHRVVELTERAKDLASDSFHVYSTIERADPIESFGHYVPGDKCHYTRLKAVIGADLNIYVCCVLKYKPKGVVVSIKDQTLKKAWDSHELQQWHEDLNISEKCVVCSFKPKNDAMSYVLENAPEHVNFL